MRLLKMVTPLSLAFISKVGSSSLRKQGKLIKTSGEGVGGRVFLGSARPGMGKGSQSVAHRKHFWPLGKRGAYLLSYQNPVWPEQVWASIAPPLKQADLICLKAT